MMNRRKLIRRTALFLLPVSALWAGSTALAGDGEMGFTNYYFTDSGANKVITTSFNMARKLLEQTTFLIDIELDHVTVPPITATTGASRPQREKNQPFEKSRGQVILGMEQGIGSNMSVAANFYRSQEFSGHSPIQSVCMEFYHGHTAGPYTTNDKFSLPSKVSD